jgi:exopolysaccharide biosynthesis polyprenyl glycosylphosphotransferase
VRDPREGNSDGLFAAETAAAAAGSSRLALSLPPALAARTERRGGHRRAWLVHRTLLLADVVGLSLAFILAQQLFEPGRASPDHVSSGLELLAFALTLPLWVIVAQLSGLYGRAVQRVDHSTVDDFAGIFAVVTIGAWAFSGFAALTSLGRPNAPRMFAFWAMAIAFVVAARALARAVARRHPIFWQNTIIVGAGEVGQLIARKLEKHPEYGIRLVGFVDVEPREPRADLESLYLLGPPDQLPELVEELGIDRVVVAYSRDSHEELLELIRKLRVTSVQIDLVPRLFEAVGPKIEMHTVEALPLIGLPPVRLSPSARVVKRAIDIVVASIGLLLTAPLFAYLALRIKRDSPGPVFFRQTRLGENMKEFTFLKFRTMYSDTDDSGHREYVKGSLSWRVTAAYDGLYKPAFEHLVTPFGRKLRKTSLDELPQLLNVLKGDMSLVGPRPCIPYETEHLASHHFERFLVPAGLTGLWQVAARNSSSFGEAMEMDVSYARSWSLGLDIRLLCRTPFAVLRQTASTA